MSRLCRSSANAMKHPYLKPQFYCLPENQFWNSEKYTLSYRQRMQELVSEMESSNSNLLNLLK